MPGRTAEQRLEELETRLAFQDNTVQALNDALADQQRQIEALRMEVETLRLRFESLTTALLAGQSEEQPH